MNFKIVGAYPSGANWSFECPMRIGRMAATSAGRRAGVKWRLGGERAGSE